MEELSQGGRMRILVLTNLYPPHYIGGYELICQTVVEVLRERGHLVNILTSNHRVAVEPLRKDELGIERTLRIHGLYGHPWLGIRKLRRLEQHNNRTLVSALRRFRTELVYVWNMGGLSKSMLFRLQETGLPSVFYLSDHWIARGLAGDVWLRWWNRKDASLAQRWMRAWWTFSGARKRWHARAPTDPPSQLRFPRIYFCSRALRDLTAAAGYDVGHGAIIPCPIHRRFYDGPMPEARKAYSRLLYVGRLAEDKGVMTALRALALLRGTFGGTLSIIGSGEPGYESQLRRYADEQRLKVSFASAKLDDMPRVYREHDGLLFTSEWAEPFALTPIEAMACGLPVIGTTTGGSAELFRHGENGLTYAAGEAEELGNRILQFASDVALREGCARRGCSEARQRYAAPVVVDQIEDYLHETLKLARRSARSE
jgi:glycogen synthase